jgi:hypothetical protein
MLGIISGDLERFPIWLRLPNTSRKHQWALDVENSELNTSKGFKVFNLVSNSDSCAIKSRKTCSASVANDIILCDVTIVIMSAPFDFDPSSFGEIVTLFIFNDGVHFTVQAIINKQWCSVSLSSKLPFETLFWPVYYFWLITVNAT